jgi:SAM-dependent methyltransferase
MRGFRSSVLSCALLLPAAALHAQAQTQTKPYEPSVGQAGKDVVWVPTSNTLVDKMLDMAHVTASDYLVDLGSGDGRTVIAAAKRGARALGIEYNPEMVELSKKAAADAGVSANATFMKADIFETDFSQATVVTMFLLPELNLRLRPKLLDMKPGTRLVSNSFTMDDWQPDERATVSGECSSWCTALYWVVPAKVEGNWQTEKGPLVLKQQFQMLTGSLNGNMIADGKMKGDQIEFSVGGLKYFGKVAGTGTSIQGTAPGGTTWRATRQLTSAR